MPCSCKFCATDYPKFKAMMVSTDIDELHKYINKLFNHWQACDDDRQHLKYKIEHPNNS